MIRPLSQGVHGKRLAAIAVVAIAVAAGGYGIASWTAQVVGPNICIRSYGPFFLAQDMPMRKSDTAAMPGSNYVVKVTGPSTLSLFSYGGDGTLAKIRDLAGTYRGAAVTALDDSWIEVAYYEPTANGFKASVRSVRVLGGNDVGTPYPIGDFPASFEPHVRFAMDTLLQNQFVVVTNIPDDLGRRNLRAMVATRSGGNPVVTLLGATAVPPSDTPEAVLDFDVAAVDYPLRNDIQFIVAFRGSQGLQIQRGREGSSGIIFDPAYLKTVSATGRDVDLASTQDRQKKLAMAYLDKGRAYAGDIVLGDPNPGPVYPDAFTPVALGNGGDVLSAPAVAWITNDYYVAAIGVRSSASDASRKGVYIRRGTAGTTSFGSELRVTNATGLESVGLTGLAGVKGRLLASQSSSVEAENGMTASYCAGCLGGVADTGEQCELPTTTGDPVVGAICDPRFCGNGQMNPGEQCDDGNTAFDDGCDALCRIECASDADCPSGECAGGICTNLCGNGIVEPPVCVVEGGGSLSCPPPTAGDIRVVNLPGGIFPLSSANGDLNKDGLQDMIVANYTGNTPPRSDGHGTYTGTIDAFLNQGNGTFAPRKQIGTFEWSDGGGDRGIDAFDADGDGDADVVVADRHGATSAGLVLLRNDNMTFTRVPFAEGFNAFHLYHGDSNDDGDPDLGIDGFGNYTADFHAALLGGPGVTFRNDSDVYVSDGSYHTQLFVDMDNDGRSDLVAQTYGETVGGQSRVRFAVYRGKADGTFDDPVFMSIDGSSVIVEIASGDFNRDGNVDIAAGENNGDILVFFGDGHGGASSTLRVKTPFGPRLLTVADPSADGVPDLVFGAGQGSEGRNLWYAASNGNGTFAAPVRFVTLNPPPSGRSPLSYNSAYFYNYFLRAADYDGDGRLDLSVTHALSSDSASIVLLRSSVASCTQTPPVVTCSQAEECDDGLSNGQPGKCTQRCTYCGNGRIDLVNGVAEECDEGADNGEPGSGCSHACTFETPPQHTECLNNQCVLRAGVGVNECNDDAQCLRESHLACTGVGACTVVQGPGMDLCGLATASADCCDPTDPTCGHDQCDFLGETCSEVPGPGLPQCSAGYQCEAFHFSCENQQCAIQPGDGPDTCASQADCTGEPSTHLACVGVGACGVVEGEGDDECLDGEADCTCLPGDPFCTHAACVNGACTQVAGPGMALCSANADCTPCPASDPLCHERCDALDMQCTASETGSCPVRCEEDRHLACENMQCVIKQGAGADECAVSADCPEIPRHLACVGVGSCAVVDGEGIDSCLTGDDCGCPLDDPTCTHAACVGTLCVEVPGPGMPLCSSNADCTACPASDPNCHQQCDALGFQCVATSQGACAEGCSDPRHLTCENRQCVSVPGAGPNTCETTADCFVPQHLACTGIGMCTLVEGAGVDSCLDGGDCTCLPDDPFCTHAACVEGQCAEVQGPGIPLCSSDDDCTPCPASDPNCHQQCAALELQCVGAPFGACADNCSEPRHLTCQDQQCAIVPGAGPDECSSQADCAESSCGNGVVDPGEACDEGPRNLADPPASLSEWYCRALSCTRSECFDGIDNDLDNLPDIIDAGCWRYDVPQRTARQGGILGFLLAQVTEPLSSLEPKEYLAGKGNESCPDGTIDRGAFCALTCEQGEICPGGEVCPEDGVCPVICGNGAIDDGEECDDGNLLDDDFCSNICRLNECDGADCPFCGDGVYQHEIGEQCDDGNAVDDDFCTNNCRIHCVSDAECPGKCDQATNQCLPPVCGDGEVNQDWERCDDGDIDDEDDCNNQCQPTCKADADCESGTCNEALKICMPICGNGYVNPGEQCDDGNQNNLDACTNACELTCTDDSTCDCDEERGVCRPLCGNGRLDPGEGCDDGNLDDRDECNNLCKIRCRPGTLCPDDQACPQDGLCPVPGVCGDGQVNGPAEQCDDGNKTDGDACTNSCTLRCSANAECPNGLICAGEECGGCANSLQCDGGFCVAGRCRQALPICGNGVVEPGEACDDGNANDADECTSSCRFPIGHACAAAAQCQTHLCNGGTCTPCSSAGECASGLRCAEGNCLYGSLQCGDGIVQAGEACDDANFIEQDQCTSACLLPFGASCTHATQCASTICSGGSCTPCRADSECSGGLRCAIGLCLSNAQMALLPNMCGNGLLESGEECDDNNAAYGDGCTPGCTLGNGPTRSEVAANVAVQLPFIPMPGLGGTNAGLHAGAGDGLNNSGPATVAVMAAGAAAGAAWVRRRFARTKR